MYFYKIIEYSGDSCWGGRGGNGYSRATFLTLSYFPFTVLIAKLIPVHCSGSIPRSPFSVIIIPWSPFSDSSYSSFSSFALIKSVFTNVCVRSTWIIHTLRTLTGANQYHFEFCNCLEHLKTRLIKRHGETKTQINFRVLLAYEQYMVVNIQRLGLVRQILTMTEEVLTPSQIKCCHECSWVFIYSLTILCMYLLMLYPCITF